MLLFIHPFGRYLKKERAAHCIHVIDNVYNALHGDPKWVDRRRQEEKLLIFLFILILAFIRFISSRLGVSA